jgi:hypothetical protein
VQFATFFATTHIFPLVACTIQEKEISNTSFVGELYSLTTYRADLVHPRTTKGCEKRRKALKKQNSMAKNTEKLLKKKDRALNNRIHMKLES